MLKVREGDQWAFAVLYDRFYRRLLDFFYALCRNRQTAEDLCQETFLRIWRLRRRYTPSGSFAAYLFTFGRNIWLEECRRIGKRRKLGVAESVEEMLVPLTSDAAKHPDVRAACAEIEEKVFAVLNRLPEEQRMAFVLRTVNGLTVEEVSEVLGCPVNTVRSRKILAVKKLRRALQGLFVI
jgi:RNA polymerase sigma-70 factor (ECF subfamily)